MVCLLVAWWGRLLLRQASKIAELEQMQGISVDIAQTQWHRTQSMLYWESLSFFGLLIGCMVFIFWLYWRDVKRTRGIQAFFAAVTHELRTPLTSIRLQAESIAENLNISLSEKNLIRRLLEDTLRLETQVNRTLELARLEGGGPVCTQTLQLKQWLDRFLKSWEMDYPSQVDFQVEVEDILIEADPMAILMIFKNLFENAIRHSKREKVLISISAKKESGGVRVVLTDNGEGYAGSQARLGKIFQKGPSSQGTGVGLYLVKVLMKRMKGWVQFISISGASSGSFSGSKERNSQNFKGFEVVLWFPEGKLHG
jgi:signal transduction histidine kinase